MAGDVQIEAGDRTVRVSSPDKVMFPERGWTKLDVVNHYLMCAAGAVRGVAGRPTMLKRWPNGVAGDPFFMKRATKNARETVAVTYPSARPGRMFVPRDVGDVVWMAQLNCLDLNPWTSRAEHVDYPDELRVDLDPTDGHDFDTARGVAATVAEVLEENGLVGWPKTSGSRGIHIYVRIEPNWTFHQVRRAGLALAREVERRHPDATTAWWKEERDGVFIDYNQNARDKTIASAYSIRPTGLVSAPFRWDELTSIDFTALDLEAFRDRWAELGDLTDGIDESAGSIAGLLRMSAADEERGLGDAPWPPHYPKQPGEPPRVQPSKRKMEG